MQLAVNLEVSAGGPSWHCSDEIADCKIIVLKTKTILMEAVKLWGIVAR